VDGERAVVCDRLWYWQGLRWAPGGLVFLGGAAAAPLQGPVPWVGWAGALVLAARLHGLADGYYARRFRRFSPRRRAGSWWLVALAAVAAAVAVDAVCAPVLLVTGPVSGAALVAYRQATGGGRRHHLVGVAVLLALAPLPAFGVVPPGRPTLLLWMVVVGVLYPVLGVLDHRELMLRVRQHRGVGGVGPQACAAAGQRPRRYDTSVDQRAKPNPVYSAIAGRFDSST
jgi:hypothetical protein